MLSTLLTTAAYLLTASATIISTNTTSACTAISLLGIETLTLLTSALDPSFVTAQSHYWSAANADLSPGCAVFPTSTSDVSAIVHALLQYPDVPFAVKSGGHNPNVGWSSVDGGVLITMRKLANTTFNAEEETADVEPGARWGEVIEALEPYGVAVVGGRIGE